MARVTKLRTRLRTCDPHFRNCAEMCGDTHHTCSDRAIPRVLAFRGGGRRGRESGRGPFGRPTRIMQMSR